MKVVISQSSPLSALRRKGLLQLTFLSVVATILSTSVLPLLAAGELSYKEFQALATTARRIDKVTMLEPPPGKAGMYMVLGDRFGVMHVYHLTRGDSVEIWKSKHLIGQIDEVILGDLDQDGYEDVIVARTTPGMVYAWGVENFDQIYESLPADYPNIQAMCIGNVDEDPIAEIIINANDKLHYIDGETFNREWTSLQDYSATRMACGDVDGDGINEIVLNSGQVVDTRSGEVEWEDEVFYNRIELLDMDGDGVLEVITEGNGLPVKVYDIDTRLEKRL
jgi:hypothetical protein